MANRIKGITVEIGGDTTKLQNALKGVNTQIKSTESQLRDVNKLLKLDPGNTELLAQKHRLLGDAVSQTKEKLATLKAAAEQANDALAKGDITKEQYDALQREIIETEEELKRLTDAANESGTALQKIAADGEKLKDIGNNVAGVGEKLMPATMAITGLGAAAVKTAADFDASMSKVAAVSGATGSDFDALREKAREMGAKTKFSASEAAEAMNYMAMAGWKTEDMLSGIEGIMNLAAASGEELATTSDIVTDALTAFGMTAQDSGHFADILAAASSNANTNVSMMGETFKYAAPIAGALGYSAEDTAEAIGLMANAGIKSSQAGTSLRKIMTELTGEIKISGEKLGTMSVVASNADGTMRDFRDIIADCRWCFSQLSESEQAAAAETLVGKTAMSGFLALMNAAPADIEKLEGAIDNCGGTAEEMALTMQDNLAGQLTILKSQLEELAISFADLLMPTIRQVVTWVQGFVDKLNSMDDSTRKVIINVALFVAALGPVLIVIGKVLAAVGTIMTIVPKVAGAIKAVQTAFAALNAVMLANPIVLIIAAIAALVAAFIYLWNTNEDFRNFWINLWNEIKEVAVKVWNALTEFFKTAWENIKSVAETIWSGLTEFFSAFWEGLKEVFTIAFEAILAIITWYFQTYFTIISTIWEIIKTVVLTVLGALQTGFTTVWTAIQTVITTAMNTISTVITTVWNAIKNTVTTVINAIKNLITTIFTGIVNGIRGQMTNMLSVVKAGFNNVRSHIVGLAGQAFSWGRDLIMGIVNGIRSCISAVASAAGHVADTIRSYLHFSVPDVGPLTDYESWMPDFMKGLAEGIQKSRGMIQSAIKDVSSDMVLSPNSDISVNADGNSSDGIVKLTQPLIVDGRTLTTIVSQIQYKQGRASLRNLGTG